MRRRIEIVVCDLCGAEVDSDRPKLKVAVDDDRVSLDVCDKDRAMILRTFDNWTERLGADNASSNGHRTPRPSRTFTAADKARNDDEWSYLETRGFTRHQGHKTNAEKAALAEREVATTN